MKKKKIQVGAEGSSHYWISENVEYEAVILCLASVFIFPLRSCIISLVFEDGGLPNGTDVVYYSRGKVVHINGMMSVSIRSNFDHVN